jgi:FkbM family methyltransferase
MSVIDHSKFLNRLKQQGIELSNFYDVGANVGRWTVQTRTVFPDARYELFEPLYGLHGSIESGSLVKDNPSVRMHAVALSNETKRGTIKILGNNGVGSSILVMDYDAKKGIEIVDCDFYRMDDIVRERSLPPPDFIKLDTQASELKVLQGGVETIGNAKFILLETWMRRVYGPETPLFHEVSGWLYQHGFVLYEILNLDDGRDADGTLRWFDAVYINKSASTFPKWML